MANVWVILFAIGFIIAVFFIIYFISKEYAKRDSDSAEILNELDRIRHAYDKKVRSIEMGPIETDPIPQNVLQAFKGISEE